MRLRRFLAAAVTVVAAASLTTTGHAVPAPTTAPDRDSFVQRHGSRLTLAGRPFRFAGGNVEWLGLENYGPVSSPTVPAGSARYATKYEVDDVLATARDMGATVIRAQTLGDTIGCPQCLEPQLGQFNPAAFAQMDLVAAEARAYGIKLVGEFDGDANAYPPPGRNAPAALGAGHAWYCTWRHRSDCERAFFTDPTLIGDYERHMRAVLDHVNPRTGLAYKDDPTFAGWVDGNNLNLLGSVPGPAMEGWLRTVSDYFHHIDRHQLFVNLSPGGGDGYLTAGALRVPGIDIYAAEYYPHWLPLISGGNRVDGNAPTVHQEAAQAAAAGKTFSVIEFGWDHTDFLTTAALQQFLAGVEADPNIVGDNYWALQAHANGHGWQPIPANAHCTPTCEWGEDGNWWALYYTGVGTAANTAADMAARAQLLRAHAYLMAGEATPPAHQPVPAPTITATAGGVVLFQGAAGSPDYAIQKQTSDGGWTTVCGGCVTDAAPGWHDPAPVVGCYRVIGRNLDNVPGPASPPAGRCDRRAG